MKIALHWFRRDLRIADNTALFTAGKENDWVIPVFIFDPKILRAPDVGARRVAYLLACLESLEKNLQTHGSFLIIRQGTVEQELEKLLQETGAQSLYFNRDYEPYARERDTTVTTLVQRVGVIPKSFKDGVIHEPDEVLKGDGTPYAVFTPYSKLWRTKKHPNVLGTPNFTPAPQGSSVPPSDGLPTLAKLGFNLDIPLPSTGERAARDLLKQFAQGNALHYESRRNYPALDATSRLSPALRFGTLSPRTILATMEKAAQEHPAARKELDTFVTELIWREFYRAILWHFPHVAQTTFKPQYEKLPWENNERLFQAWCEGRTGYPIVDAGMCQLNTTGWMHNRVRMIVSSFLTKDLLVNWQWGERYFMQQLVDGDLSANNGGWQWSASTGTDAQPYFRIFNPQSQAEKFDPEGRYIQRYVEEINHLNYPAPIVNHAEQRVKALALFKRVGA